MSSAYPSEFVRLAAIGTKQLNVVVKFDGIDTAFSILPTYKSLKYGDPGVYYGQPGLVYGGYRLLPDVLSVLSVESNLTISQRLEPEQGRASIQQLTLVLIDKNYQVSQALYDAGEMLGRRCKVSIGFQNSSYPDDYIAASRGLITNVQFQTGRVVITLGDLGQRRRTAIFQSAKTTLTYAINSTTTSIPVVSYADFYDLTVDQGALPSTAWRVRPYLHIGDEYILYGYNPFHPTGTHAPYIQVLERGARGTTKVSHDVGDEVSHAVELQENALLLALQIMLSGNGVLDLGNAAALGGVVDPNVPHATNVILLPGSVDANRDFGLVVGDSVTVAGSGKSANNKTVTVTGFGSAFGETNRLIYCSDSFQYENPSTATLTFRSQFDVLPTQIGLKIPPAEVDTQGHIDLKNLYFYGSEYTLKIFVTDQQTGKDFIESQLYFPIGAYSLTRQGRLSVGFTRPPMATQSLVFLDSSNVIEPNAITTQRGLNSRKFFNQIQYEYDPTDAGAYQAVIRALDTDSLNEIGVMTLLPIKSNGLHGANGELVADRVTRRLLGRYKRGAVEISLKVNFAAGSQIESGDVVAVVDDGGLAIQNFETGNRYLGSMLLEVTDRTLDVKTGQSQLKLVTGLGSQLDDRYGTIAPSSKLLSTSTNVLLRMDSTSFGATTQAAKWADYVGQTIRVHSPTYSVSGTTTLTGISATVPDALEVSPALGFTPGANYIVEIDSYPATTNPDDDALYKMIYSFLDPTLSVLAGSTSTVIQLSTVDAAKCTAGQKVIVHNADYSIESAETAIQSVSATSITLASALSFTPAAGQKVDLIGFIDGGGPYRFA